MTEENKVQLERIEAYREGNQLEVKAAQGGMPDTLWDSYSAFANTDGGCILLGVKERDDHSFYAVGLKDAEKMKKDFWNMVNNRQKISVNLMTERRVRIEQVDGKDIIVLWPGRWHAEQSVCRQIGDKATDYHQKCRQSADKCFKCADKCRQQHPKCR